MTALMTAVRLTDHYYRFSTSPINRNPLNHRSFYLSIDAAIDVAIDLTLHVIPGQSAGSAASARCRITACAAESAAGRAAGGPSAGRGRRTSTSACRGGWP